MTVSPQYPGQRSLGKRPAAAGQDCADVIQFLKLFCLPAFVKVPIMAVVIFWKFCIRCDLAG